MPACMRGLLVILLLGLRQTPQRGNYTKSAALFFVRMHQHLLAYWFKPNKVHRVRKASITQLNKKEMKKYIFLFIAVCFTTTLSAQNVVIQTNNTDSQSSTAQTTGNEYYINGISTAQDIGGVDVAFIKDQNGDWTGSPEKPDYHDYFLSFTNYHEFTVTILFEVTEGSRKTTGTITVPKGITKRTPNSYWLNGNFNIVTIVRKI